jgi:signal transduction histidine kinase
MKRVVFKKLLLLAIVNTIVFIGIFSLSVVVCVSIAVHTNQISIDNVIYNRTPIVSTEDDGTVVVQTPDLEYMVDAKDAYDNGFGYFYEKNTEVEEAHFSLKINDESVIRFSGKFSDFLSYFISLAISFILSIVSVIISTIIFSKKLTDKMIESLESIRYDEKKDEYKLFPEETVPEFQPFINMMTKRVRKRKEFNANASHELKTPLSVIAHASENLKLKYKNKNDDVYDTAEIISIRVNELIELTDMNLRLAKYNEGDFVLNKTKFNLADTISDVIVNLIEKANTLDKSVRFEPEVLEIMADETMIEDVVFNLLNNAIKYSFKNIDIKITEDENFVVFEISNDGEEIPSEDIDHLFERYYRVDKSHNSETGGYGIGLSMVKSIVDLHNGEIYVTSSKDKTVFAVRLPKF